jgi:hypothetical protein
MELLVQQRCVSRFYNDLQDARDRQTQRKSYKTTRIVGGLRHFRKRFHNLVLS